MKPFSPYPQTQLDDRPASLRAPPPAYTPYDSRTQFDKGISSGLRVAQGGMRGGVAAVATGLGASDFGREQAAIASSEMEIPPEDVGRVTDINNVKSFKDLTDYVGYGLGSSLPSMAVGGVVGGVAGIARGAGAAALGAGVASGVQQGGALFASETQRLPDRDPREIAAASAVAGIGMGALESLPLMQAFNRLGVGRMGRRIIGNAAKSSVEEGATEGAQTLIERGTRKFLDDNYEVFDEEGRNELLNSVALGGIIGGGLGGATGVLPSSPFRDSVDRHEAEDELRRLRVDRASNALRDLDPETGPVLDQLKNADDYVGLENLLINRSTPSPENWPLPFIGDNDLVELSPENRPLPFTGNDGFADVKRERSRLTLDNYRNAEQARRETARNRTQRNLSQVGYVQRDAEIADLLGNVVDDTVEEDVSSTADDMGDNVDDFDGSEGDSYENTLTVNPDAVSTDLSPEYALGRRAYDAGYMVNKDTGELGNVDMTPAERDVFMDGRTRADLQSEARPLDEYLADQYNQKQNSTNIKEAVRGPQSLEEFFDIEADRVLFNELGKNSTGKKATFLQDARKNTSSQEFLNLFDTMQRSQVPRQMRSDPESAVTQGPDSVVVDAKESSTGGEARVKRAWSENKNLWMTYIKDHAKNTARAIRMPTTLKRYYEQSLNAGDINKASVPEMYDAFERFVTEQADKGFEVAVDDRMIIGSVSEQPVTLAAARRASQASKDPRVALQQRVEAAKEKLQSAGTTGSNLNALKTRVQDAESALQMFDSKTLAGLKKAVADATAKGVKDELESATNELARYKQNRDREIALDNAEFDKFSIRKGSADYTPAADLANPEFASDSANRFRASYNAIAQRLRDQLRLKDRSDFLATLAVKVLDAKSADEVAKILNGDPKAPLGDPARKPALSPTMLDLLRNMIGPAKPPHKDDWFGITWRLENGEVRRTNDTAYQITSDVKVTTARNGATEWRLSFKKVSDGKQYNNFVVRSDGMHDGRNVFRFENIKPFNQSQKHAIVDALDTLALYTKQKVANVDMETTLTMSRDFELDKEVDADTAGGATTVRSEATRLEAAPVRLEAESERAILKELALRQADMDMADQRHESLSAMEEELLLQRADMEIDRSTVGLNGWNAGRENAPKVRRYEVKEAQMVADWIRALGVKRKVQVVTADEIYGLKPSTAPDSVLAALRKEFLGNTRGAAIARSKRAELFVAVNPSLTNQRVRQAVLAHEFGHAVFKDFIRGHLTKDVLARDVQAEFLKWLRKTKGKSLGDVLASKMAKDLFEHYAQDDSVDLDARLRSMSRAEIDYHLDFEEWFADQTSRWLKRQRTLPPEGRIDRFFWRAAELLRSIWGVFEEQDFKPAASVDAFLRGTVYRAHGIYADRWISNLTGNIPYPKDVLQAINKDTLTPYATTVPDAALLQRLVPYSDAAVRQMQRAFSTLLTPEERRVVGRVMTGWHVQRQILEYTQKNIPHMFERAAADPNTLMSIGYQMWLQKDLNLGPDGKNLFTKVNKTLDSAFGLISEHQQAEAVLTAMQGGLMTLRNHSKGFFVLRDRSARDTLLKRLAQGAMESYKAIAPMVDTMLFPVQRRLLKTGVPELRKLAERMAPIAGQSRVGEPYTIAKGRRLAELQGRYQRMSEKWDEDTKRQVWELLYDPERLKTAPKNEATAAARNVKSLFVHYYRYARGALQMDFRQDYFPWVFNTRALQDDAAAFMGMMRHPKHAKEINALAAAWGVDVDSVPQRVLDHILDQKGSATLGQMPANEADNASQKEQHSPFFGFNAVRALNFLYTNGTQSERETLRTWMDQNLDHTVYMYTEQMVKRVEFAKQFGANGEGLEQTFSNAKENGATDKDIKLAKDYVAAMLGYHGRDTNRALHRLFGKEAPPDGQVINPALRGVMAGVMVAQNLAILGLATFSSLTDPIGVGVRIGDFGTAMKAYRAGVKEVYAAVKRQIPGKKAQMTRAEELARAVGIIEERLIMESLSWQYSSTHLPHWLNAINEGFFKLTMLNQWTQLTRTMATAGAEQFLLAHRKGKETRNSARYLEELGLKVDDVIDERGQLKVLTRDERKVADAAELARDDRVRAAMFQFVDESIVRPTPNTRPLWMNDPHFMLIGHLKHFMFGFHEQILRRVWNEIGHRNYGPTAMLMSLVPAMMAANVLRETFKNAIDGDEEGEDEDPFNQSWWEAMQRAGLTGIFQVFLDAKRDVDYGGSLFSSALGPTWDNGLSKLPKIMSGDESAIIDQLPLQNVFGGFYKDLLPIE